MGIGKVGFGKVGIGKVGIGEVGFGEVGFGEVGGHHSDRTRGHSKKLVKDSFRKFFFE